MATLGLNARRHTIWKRLATALVAVVKKSIQLSNTCGRLPVEHDGDIKSFLPTHHLHTLKLSCNIDTFVNTNISSMCRDE